MRVSFNPFKSIVAVVVAILTAIQKLVNSVAQNRFAQPQARPRRTNPTEAIPLPAPAPKTTPAKTDIAAVSLKPAGPKVPLDSIIEPMIATTVSAPNPTAPAKAKDAIVDSRHPAIPAELVKSEQPKPTPQQKAVARPSASTAKPASSAANSSATGARTMPGKLNSNLLKTAGSIKLGAPGQPMPTPPKSVEPAVTAPAEPAVTPEHVVTTEPVDTKPTMTQAEMLKRKPKKAVKTAPTRRAVITIAKEDQSAGKGIGVKYTL